jgi:prostaglandin-E synthase 1
MGHPVKEPYMNNGEAFLIYSTCMVVLCLNVLFLWAFSGGVRSKTKTTPNPEDASTVSRGSSVVTSDPPEVARVLRAHRNAADNILPFAILGFLYVAWGASPLAVGIFCGIFTAARVGHSIAYLGEKQPWRTVLFTIGGLDTLVMTAFLIRGLVAAA